MLKSKKNICTFECINGIWKQDENKQETITTFSSVTMIICATTHLPKEEPLIFYTGITSLN